MYILIIFREYNDILKGLKWPFCGNNASSLHIPVPEILMKFKILTEYLLHLQLPYPCMKCKFYFCILLRFFIIIFYYYRKIIFYY